VNLDQIRKVSVPSDHKIPDHKIPTTKSLTTKSPKLP
jgi:hypothetical protein